MAVIRWRDSYNTGLEPVDQEHRKLVELIEAMHSIIRDKEPEEVVDKVITEIVEYTQFHFGNEEKLMRDKQYPQLEAHMAEHQQLIKEVTTFKERLLRDFPDGNQEFYRFLREWLVNHILESDKQFGTYVASQ